MHILIYLYKTPSKRSADPRKFLSGAHLTNHHSPINQSTTHQLQASSNSAGHLTVEQRTRCSFSHFSPNLHRFFAIFCKILHFFSLFLTFFLTYFTQIAQTNPNRRSKTTKNYLRTGHRTPIIGVKTNAVHRF